MKPVLKAPVSIPLKLRYDGLLSKSAFKFNLRHYIVVPYQYYVASIGYQLEQKGDDDGFYTNLFMIIYGLGALLSPLGGALVGAAHVTPRF
jgi:hypothetical protein